MAPRIDSSSCGSAPHRIWKSSAASTLGPRCMSFCVLNVPAAITTLSAVKVRLRAPKGPPRRRAVRRHLPHLPSGRWRRPSTVVRSTCTGRFHRQTGVVRRECSCADARQPVMQRAAFGARGARGTGTAKVRVGHGLAGRAVATGLRPEEDADRRLVTKVPATPISSRPLRSGRSWRERPDLTTPEHSASGRSAGSVLTPVGDVAHCLSLKNGDGRTGSVRVIQ